ncbi:MAG: hypothetical protein C0597_01790 [Marinilabiliales bacterium]|nr:MAG: hypothetical protein C0597_01790 [Marinilabiliales bacterium]
MIKPTTLTWIIAIFGIITFFPLMVAQLMMIFKPNSQKTKDLIIGKGEDWRDKSHYKYSLAFAWADWLIIFPLLVLSYWGVLVGQNWGYILWIALGTISLYFSITFWVLEREYALPSVGRLAYYTFIWGFFLYWGIAAIIYSILNLI